MKHAFLWFFVFCTVVVSVAPAQTKVFVKSPGGISGFAGMAVLPDGTIVMAANPRNLRGFDVDSQTFVFSVQYPEFGFVDDVALVPGTGGSYVVAATGFLDGAIKTISSSGVFGLANNDWTVPTPGLGSYQTNFSFALLGANPITYRSSNGLLYVGTSFNNAQLFKMGTNLSTPIAIDLDNAFNNNAFAFGPDGYLYGPNTNGSDPTNSHISRIAINDTTNTGTVTHIISGVDAPVAVKVKSNGKLFYLERTTARLFRFNPAHAVGPSNPLHLATFKPPLDNLCFNNDETELYISGNNNRLFRYVLATGYKQTLYDADVTFPWDLAYDDETKSIFSADTSGVTQYKASNGRILQSVVFDSKQDGGSLIGVGNANGLSLGSGPAAKILVVDGTIGGLILLHKSNLTRAAFYNPFVYNTGLGFRQPYSAVLVDSDDEDPDNDYILATDTIGGSILKIFNLTGTVNNTVWYSGLVGPVKLLLHDDYVYLVEGGDLPNFNNHSGVISRFNLSDTPVKESLVSGLNAPQGMDIHEGKMYFVEGGNRRVMRAKSHEPSTPVVIYNGLDLGGVTVISQFNPYPVYPLAGLTIDSKGKKIWVTQYGTMVGILEIKL